MKAVLKYLHDEDKEWYNNSLVQSGDRQGDESVDASGNNAHPCFDVLLRNRFMEELCSRARQDRPRWLETTHRFCGISQLCCVM